MPAPHRSARGLSANPPEARPPVVLTERLVVTALTIKSDLDKAAKVWEDNFRDPIKAAMLALPQLPQPEITEKILGGVRLFLVKTFPKDAFDTVRMAARMSQSIAAGQITNEDLRTLFDTGAITVAQPEAVAGLLAARAHVPAVEFVIQPENPDVPSRIDLKWAVVPGRAALVGPLVNLPDQVAVAAAGSNPGRAVATPPGLSPAMAAAMAIDAQNAAGRRGPAVELTGPIQPPTPAPADPQPQGRTVVVRRSPRRRTRRTR